MFNTPLLSPLDVYQQALAQGFVSDPAQHAAVVALNDCFHALHPAHQGQAPLPQAAQAEKAHQGQAQSQGQALSQRDAKVSEVSGTGTALEPSQEPPLGQARGVYLWGPVGRGKTWLMDSFFTTLRVPAKRQHFHHFLAWLHRRLFELTGTINPLQQVAEELARDIQVLCFDELFVNDIGDAMLLGPLFQALFDAGVVLVTTSNQPPQALYEDGFNRERFLPAIEALLAHTQVVHLDGEQDHRLHGDKTLERYFVGDSTGVLSTQLEHLFTQLSTAKAQPTNVQIGSRQLYALGAHQQTLWCDFAQLCEGKLAAQDYMQLCQQYQHIILSGIPNLSAAQQQARIARGTEDAPAKVDAGDRVLLNLAKNDDAVRRFIALVDECYEQKVTLYLEAAVPLEQLYTEGALLFPFQRARSRIEEMQRKA